MLFFPDELSGITPSTLEQVYALAERALSAGEDSGQGIGVACLHLEGFDQCARGAGEPAAVSAFVGVLELLPISPEQLLGGFREGPQAFIFVQGIHIEGLRRFAEACCAIDMPDPFLGAPKFGMSVGAAHSSGSRSGSSSIADIRFAALRGVRLALRTGGGRFAYIERFGPALPVVPQSGKSSKSDSGTVARACNIAPNPRPQLATKPDQPKPTVDPAQLRLDAGPAPPSSDQVHDQFALPTDSTEELKELMRSSEKQWQLRVDRLERRLDKMSQLLEGSVAESKVLESKPSGVPSRFRKVQGLDQGDNQFEAKAGLMSALFLANKDIQDRLNERTAG